MFKTICKTALKTLLLLAVVVLVAFGVASLGFPSEMAGLCEKSGNYSFATVYADLSYKYTKDVNDLNRCFTDSVYAGNDSKIVKYGDDLIKDEKFAEVCEDITVIKITNGSEEKEISVDYKQYVYGRVAAAKYRRDKKDEALELATKAMEGVSGFPKNNALAILSLQVIESGDKDTAKTLLAEVEKHQDAANEYYTALVNELTKVSSQE